MERRSILRNKRGDATDPMIVLIIIAFLAISFIVTIFVNSKIRSIITDTKLMNSTAAPSIVSGLDNVNNNLVQRGFITIIAILVIFTMLSAFMVRQHPAFIFLNIIMLAVTIFVAVFVANVYGALENNSTLAPILAQQVMITYVMKHIVMILLGIGAIDMIILFSKLFNAPQGGGGDFGQ